jgi:hypothetical protein
MRNILLFNQRSSPLCKLLIPDSCQSPASHVAFDTSNFRLSYTYTSKTDERLVRNILCSYSAHSIPASHSTPTCAALWLGPFQCVPLESSQLFLRSVSEARGIDILSKRPSKRLLAADLLAAYERVYRHGDCAVDIGRRAKVGQSHFAKRLRYAHDCL